MRPITATIAIAMMSFCLVGTGAKKRIRKAGCKVGRVTKRDDVTAKSGKVVHQGPKAGRKLAPGTKVNVTFG